MRKVPSTIASRLHLAAGLIADRGLEQTRIDDIAEATGVPRATLYYYFAGKEDMLAHLLGDMLQATAAAVAVASESRGTARRRLGLVVEAQLEVMAAYPSTCQALLAEFGRIERIPALATAVEDAYYTPVRRLLLDGADDGSLRAVDAPLASRAVFGAVTVNGLARLVTGEPLRPAELAADIVDLLTRGLGADGKSHAGMRKPTGPPVAAIRR